ncbi:hypothetical protein Asi02nite_69500 [Asanoa siamensis]|uniref:Uncharacterized protein n=1 Tax=Asanoa siamensis TaxID=926357 RepID=A0ABQ4D1L2_9ACTN|nr:hypothetical protein Asi02nite_69500 [Asanoa siamensis]
MRVRVAATTAALIGAAGLALFMSPAFAGSGLSPATSVPASPSPVPVNPSPVPVKPSPVPELPTFGPGDPSPVPVHPISN